MDMVDGLGVINFRVTISGGALSESQNMECVVVVAGWLDSIGCWMSKVPLEDGSHGTKSNHGSKLTLRRLNELWLDPTADDESDVCCSMEWDVCSGVSFSRLTRRCFLGLTLILLFIIVSVFILQHCTIRWNLV